MTKAELIDYAIRTGAPMEGVENLQAIEDEGEVYESIEEVWADYPTDDDFLWNEDEYEKSRQQSAFCSCDSQKKQ